MQVDEALAAFLVSPVMIIVGTSDARGRPEIGRAVDCRVLPGTGIELVISAWQWPGTNANVRDTGRAAATISRPADYETFQVKGGARLRPAEAPDLELVRRYMAAITEVLDALGISPRLSAVWQTVEDAVILHLATEAVFVQTPGPRAGQPVAPT